MFDDFVSSLHLAIYLTMINQRDSFLDTELIVEFPKFFAVKLYVVV